MIGLEQVLDKPGEENKHKAVLLHFHFIGSLLQARHSAFSLANHVYTSPPQEPHQTSKLPLWEVPRCRVVNTVEKPCSTLLVTWKDALTGFNFDLSSPPWPGEVDHEAAGL